MLHQAEKYIKQIVEEIGRPSYMQEFLKQGKDKKEKGDRRRGRKTETVQ